MAAGDAGGDLGCDQGRIGITCPPMMGDAGGDLGCDQGPPHRPCHQGPG